MQHVLVVVVLFSFVISTNVMADPLPSTPGGTTSQHPATSDSAHVQPRGTGYAPNSATEIAVQERLTTFIEQQDQMTADFDKRLKICRGC